VLSTQNLQGTITGNQTHTFLLQESLPIGTYYIDMYCNFTGLLTQFNSTSFSIISGLKFNNISWNSTILRSGGIYLLNYSINNTRNNNLSTEIQIRGNSLSQNLTFTNQNLTALALTDIVYPIEFSRTSSIGNNEIYFEIYRNNQLYENFTINATIFSPIEIKRVRMDPAGFVNENFSVFVELTNFIASAENISIHFEGEYFTTVDLNEITIEANITKTINITSIVQNNAVNGLVLFEIFINRSIDGTVLNESEYLTTIKSKLDVIALTLPSASFHWTQTSATLLIRNNMLKNQQITVYVNNERISEGISVIPGNNEISINIGNNINPYEIGNKFYTIKIVDSEGNVIIEQMMESQVQYSIGSLLVGYILPFAIPIVGVIIYRHMDLENKRKLI
jgi:hypothetical protein